MEGKKERERYDQLQGVRAPERRAGRAPAESGPWRKWDVYRAVIQKTTLAQRWGWGRCSDSSDSSSTRRNDAQPWVCGIQKTHNSLKGILSNFLPLYPIIPFQKAFSPPQMIYRWRCHPVAICTEVLHETELITVFSLFHYKAFLMLRVFVFCLSNSIKTPSLQSHPRNLAFKKLPRTFVKAAIGTWCGVISW